MSAIPGPLAARGPLPSGTVTFAFTDIEGSTQRWERDQAAMQDAVRRHDTLMRVALVGHGGYVFKTVGDAFCVAFWRPEDAVVALLAAQRALIAQDFSGVGGLRVRMAAHTGTVDERDGDYFGHAVNRVARLLAIGHGGQVLVSGTTADLLQGTLPPQVSLHDLGEHQLKDLARPEHIYQLLAPDLPNDFAPLRSLNARPNNLPRMLTSFLGREEEIAELCALLERHQLVTLVGSGGVGKTRTSLQVAANRLDAWDDGVWFIELAPLTSDDYIVTTVAHVLGATLSAQGDPLASLVRALQKKHVLLVFDNCEHLIEGAARVISALLRGCPRLKVMASSRQGLAIAGEAIYRMPSLELPSATALFIERARTADQRFLATDDNAAVILDVCRRLDGIPLAIELAAARMKMLSPRQLRERLDERFRVLTGGGRDVLPRQQTLRALIDWSYDLLDDRERRLFRRLGTFVNGFTLEGAVAVGNAQDFDEFEAFDVLASLVDKSLVLAEPAGNSLRYRLLESTRAYAVEMLVAAGEREDCQTRHLRHMHAHVAAARQVWDRTARTSVMDDALRAELEDIRAALDWAIDGSEAVLGGELVADIGPRWESLGLDSEGLARHEINLRVVPVEQSHVLARLTSNFASLLGNSGRQARACEIAMRAIAEARVSADPLTLVDALRAYSFYSVELNRPDEAEAALAEAESISIASLRSRLALLGTRAHLSKLRGDVATAVKNYEEICGTYRSLGDGHGFRRSTLNLAEIEHSRGHTRRAIELARETLPALRAVGDRSLRVLGLANLAAYLAAVDDFAEACAMAREAIREFGAPEVDSPFVAITIEVLALAFAYRGDLAGACPLAAYAGAALLRDGFARGVTETTTHDRLAALLAERINPDELAQRLAAGAALSPEAAIALALENT